MARMSRNDRLVLSAAGALAVAALAGTFFFARGDGTVGQEQLREPIPPAASVSASPGKDPHLAEPAGPPNVAVWPETRRGPAALACQEAPAWREYRQGTVGRFAAEFLDLDSPYIERIEEGDVYAVSAGFDPIARVQVEEFGAPGCWSVTGVTAPDTALMSYEIRNGYLEVVFDEKLPMLELHVAWGPHESLGTTRDAARVRADFGRKGPTRPGSWIAVWKDTEGEVLGAWAVTFPAGPRAGWSR